MIISILVCFLIVAVVIISLILKNQSNINDYYDDRIMELRQDYIRLKQDVIDDYQSHVYINNNLGKIIYDNKKELLDKIEVLNKMITTVRTNQNNPTEYL